MTKGNKAARRILLPAFVAAIALVAALWTGYTAEEAEAVPTDLTIGLDMKSAFGNPSTYDINNLPTFEQCVDVSTSVDTGFFYLDVFVLNVTNLFAYNVDITFTATKMAIVESNAKMFLGNSASIYNLSRNDQNDTGVISPAVTDGVFYAGALDIGTPNTGSGVMARIKGQGFAFGGGSVIDFRIDVTPAQSHGVTLTTDPGAQHPGDTDGDGLFDGPFINQIGKIAVNRPDGDLDTVSNDCDNCPTVSNTNQANNDGDSQGDACDTDDDNDGILDGSDTCPFIYDPTNNPAACTDTDGDGVMNGVDNCPTVSNANQANNDGDAEGDACDTDDDNDGVPDTSDNCDFDANPGQGDWNSDGQGDACDDSDADGWMDDVDNCRTVLQYNQNNSDTIKVFPSDPLPDAYGDACDNCPTTSNNDQADFNTDGIGDACSDMDGDNYTDKVELFTGRDPYLKCAATTAVNDEAMDATPTDNDDNRLVDGADVLKYGLVFLSAAPGPPYQQRYDITMNGLIDGADVLKFGIVFLTTCTP